MRQGASWVMSSHQHWYIASGSPWWRSLHSMNLSIKCLQGAVLYTLWPSTKTFDSDWNMLWFTKTTTSNAMLPSSSAPLAKTAPHYPWSLASHWSTWSQGRNHCHYTDWWVWWFLCQLHLAQWQCSQNCSVWDYLSIVLTSYIASSIICQMRSASWCTEAVHDWHSMILGQGESCLEIGVPKWLIIRYILYLYTCSMLHGAQGVLDWYMIFVVDESPVWQLACQKDLLLDTVCISTCSRMPTRQLF